MTRSVLLSTMILQMKQSFVRPMYRFCLIISPILNTVLLYKMFSNSGKGDFVAYVVLGAGLMSMWSCICFSSTGDINREQASGTLALIFSSPAGFSTVFLGKIMGNTLLSTLSLAFSLATAFIIFRVPFLPVAPAYLAISSAGVVISFATISYALACLLALSRRTALYMNCLEIPFILLCGISFPIEVLPTWLQHISMCLAPTWAVDMLRMAVLGVAQEQAFWHKFFILIILTFTLIIFTVWLHKVIDKRVRIHATLEVC